MKAPLSVCLASTLIACVFALPAPAADAPPRWLRYPAISPDGKQIAFSYQGDIWLVPTAGGAGGRAVALTSHAAYERSPVWSPDSKHLAFASDRHGNFDLFLVPVTGGTPTRLTYHSAPDEPTGFTPDGQRILFTSNRLDSAQANVGNARLGELYSIFAFHEQGESKWETQVLTTPAESAKFSKDGKLIVYYDHKGYEDEWRKHHQSPIARDLWTFDPATGKHAKLTTFAGEDRDPVWDPAAKLPNHSLYYLSERAGSFNVWHMDLSKPEQPVQITNHRKHPVRFLTIANDGTLCYGYHGNIYLRPPGTAANAIPIPVEIDVVSDDRLNSIELKTFRDGATEFAVSPKEDEVAFVVRGDIFVASVEHGTTKRVTNTPDQDRSICFSNDGRTIYFATERVRNWDLYRVTLTRKEEDRFFDSTFNASELLFKGSDDAFQPVLSPDGKRIAFLHNRDELRVLDLETKKTKTIVPAARNYSYSDGDIRYAWSPDSKWLAFSYHGHKRWIEDVGVASVEADDPSKSIINMSESGYHEGDPQWSRDSRALYFYSNRFGRRNHGSWGSDGDVFAQYLTREAFDRAALSPEEFDRLKKKEDAKKKTVTTETRKHGEENGNSDEKKDDEEKKDEKEDDKKPEPIRPVVIEAENREHRLRRATMLSAPLGSYAVSPDGEAVVYLAQVERKWDLWLSRPRDQETRKLVTLGDDSAGDVVFSKNGRTVFLRRGNGKIEKIEVGSSVGRMKDRSATAGAPKVETVNYAAEMTINTPQERSSIFQHMWRQVEAKFYDPKLHGVEWSDIWGNYRVFLPSITNNHDFAELCSEMLGELNASHTGCKYRPRHEGGDATASLGLIYDVKHPGPYLKIAEVIPRGPADKAASKLAPGLIIRHIDGVELTDDINPWSLLNRKEGKLVRVSFENAEGSKGWEEVLKPISLGEESNLLYERWIARRRAYVETLSNGKVGYVHVRGMNDGSYRRTFQDALGINSDKTALVVDTRNNGGGWLHDDLVGFLGGKDYVWFTPRGKNKGDLGAEPHLRWSRPVAVVMSESNYSDAHFFPFAFKTLGVGKLVGTPVAGTATAVWWETQIDPTLVFGIPQVGMIDLNGKYLENQTLDPDVLVYHDPESAAKGEDPQLKKAVEVLLEQVKK